MSELEIERDLAAELANFQEIALALKPSSGGIPRLPGVDIYGLTRPLAEAIGGDHIIYIDFKRRYDLDRRTADAEKEGLLQVVDRLEQCRHRAGILVADVSGHKATDALVAAMLHQAFLLGVYYELDRFGEITTKLFEHINQRFYQTTSVRKYLTMLYGEISQEGRFRFISAGHPRPMIFSREYRRFANISEDRMVSYPPVGMMPSGAAVGERAGPGALGYKKRYTVNEIDLLAGGDILLLYTDGLSEHGNGEFFPGEVERVLAASEGLDAQSICEVLEARLLDFATPDDDISFVVVRKLATPLSAV
jgi:serine phosphatase RsbU (regulator of sigma subunit)